MITVNLIPWPQLTRRGTPEFRVVRRPLILSGQTFEPGAIVPHSVFYDRSRLRQMYEQRRIEPVVAPEGSRQQAREAREARGVAMASAAPLLGSTYQPSRRKKGA